MAAHDAGVPLPRPQPGQLTPWPARAVADPGQLTPWPARAVADPGQLAAALARLREDGYLKLAVPVRLGGTGLNLRQVARAQRRLAARMPAAAFAVNAHHAWIGAAADTLASGGPADPLAGWLVREAAQGGFIAGWPWPATGTACDLGELEALAGDPPGWDWAAAPVTDDSQAGRPARGYAFTRRPDSPAPAPIMPPRSPGDALVAGMFSWALPLAGMTWYATGRRAFGQAVRQAQPRRDGGGRRVRRRDEPGHPLDQWPVTEAALRLDGIRAQLDRVIGCWQQRITAGGAITSLDPGGQWLIRLFTVRYAAADGARRVIELARQITEQAREQAGPVGPLSSMIDAD